MARAARPPIIAVMGHIDHGKSSLLDYIRKTNVTAGEAGGITQHVSAYVAEHNGRAITFLDTPGHEAFKTTRARGAASADIAILVVAADEGFMPQTQDALDAITGSGIPFLVAITKIDKNNADVDRAKTSLLEHGIYLEGLGGDIAYAPVSSKTGEGVPELLDLVLLATDLAEPMADADASAQGFVLESSQDPKRGASATLIVKDGTLRTGTFVVAGGAFAPVRFIEDFRGARVPEAKPSAPARVSGFSALPAAGTPFTIAASKKEAEALAKEQAAEKAAPAAAVAAEAGVAELPLVIKADVQGSVDAILHELAKITHENAKIRVLATGVGAVSEGDEKIAHAAGGSIVAFNTNIDAIARDTALRDGVPIESFTIIYELAEKVAELLALRAPVVERDEELGRAKVLKPFSSSAKKQVLGARFVTGTLALGAQVKLVRAGEEIARGKITNLQQARANVSSVGVEGDFGMELELRVPVVYGDEVVAFTRTKS